MWRERQTVVLGLTAAFPFLVIINSYSSIYPTPLGIVATKKGEIENIIIFLVAKTLLCVRMN